MKGPSLRMTHRANKYFLEDHKFLLLHHHTPLPATDKYMKNIFCTHMQMIQIRKDDGNSQTLSI